MKGDRDVPDFVVGVSTSPRRNHQESTGVLALIQSNFAALSITMGDPML
jgi:hypothetical protein